MVICNDNCIFSCDKTFKFHVINFIHEQMTLQNLHFVIKITFSHKLNFVILLLLYLLFQKYFCFLFILKKNSTRFGSTISSNFQGAILRVISNILHSSRPIRLKIFYFLVIKLFIYIQYGVFLWANRFIRLKVKLKKSLLNINTACVPIIYHF